MKVLLLLVMQRIRIPIKKKPNETSNEINIKSTKPKIKRKQPVNDPATWKYEQLDLGEFRQILHISDIHIRPLQRHEEFREVFKKTTEKIRDLSQEKPSLIAITGDVFDNKTNFKPETFKICRDFLKELSRACPVVMIAGNHDMLEGNTNRMDAITPVVDDIPNLHYLKYSGVYHSRHTEHSFVVSSLYDKQFLRRDEIQEAEKPRKYVALYHGALTGAKTDTGYVTNEENNDINSDINDGINDTNDLESGNVNTGNSTRYRSTHDFDGYDAVLLGDIHKHQVLKNDIGSPVAYAGSLVQQNHGENRQGHGILVWDQDLKPDLVPIDNDYGFVDVHCDNGKWTTESSDLPDHCYARLVIRNCTQTQVDIITTELKQRVKTLHVTKKNCISDELNEYEIPPDVKRKEDEIQLIKEQAKQYNFEPQALVDLHKHYQEIIDSEEHQMSTAVWKPITVEFKNMFGYGNNRVNKIRFKRGVTTIIANNATGKTSIVNIILFAIFGRTPLNPSSTTYTFDIINNAQQSGYVKILVKHGEQFYLIERKTIRQNNKSTSAVLKKLNRYDFTCEIWDSNINGDKVTNRCEIRKNNNDTFIKQLFGDISDFSLCNFLNKESSLNLLNMTPTEQVKTLKRLFKMGVYDEYRELNKQEISNLEKEIEKKKGKRASLQEVQDKEITEDTLIQCQEEIDNYEQLISGLIQQLEQAENRLEGKRNHHQSLMAEKSQLEGLLSEVVFDKEFTDGHEHNSIEKKLLEALRAPELMDVKDTGDNLQYLELQVGNIKQLLNSQSEPEYSREELEQQLTDLQQELEELEQPSELVELNHIVLQRKFGNLSGELERIEDALKEMKEMKETEKIEDIKQLHQRITSLTQGITPLRTDPEEIELRLNEIQKIISSMPHVDMESRSLDIKSIKSRMAFLESELRVLDHRRDPDYSPGASIDNKQNLQGQLHPGVSAVLYRDDFSVIPELESEVMNLTKKLEQSHETIIVDTGKYIDILAECPLLAPELKEQYNLDLDKDYCIVDEGSVNRLMDHLEHEDQRKAILTVITKLNKSLSQKQEKLETLKNRQVENQLIQENLSINSKIAQLDWLAYEQELAELKYLYTHYELTVESQKLEKQLKVHQYNQELEEELKIAKLQLEYHTTIAARKTIETELLTVQDQLNYLLIKEDIAQVHQDIHNLDKITHLREDLEKYQTLFNQQRLWERKQSLSRQLETCYQMIRLNTTLKTEIEVSHSEIERISASVNTMKHEQSSLQYKLGAAQEALSISQFRYDKSQQVQLDLERLESEITTHEHEIIPMQDYNVIMGNKGITSVLLYNKIKAIEEYINTIISSFTKYSINILYDEKKQTINIITVNKSGNYLSTSRLSGYEKLMLQLSFKRALNKFSYNSKSSIMIIDEALDFIDQENFISKLPDAMNLVTQDYASCLAISQRDITHISDNVIRVENRGGTGMIV